jgi:hypothetical protein
LLFPASNALVECTTYFGYSYERLGASRRGWPGMLVPVFFLALQHIAIPLYLDGMYLLWRFLSFLPMALVVGIFYFKIRRLSPIVPAHFLADLSTLALILFAPA